MTRYSVEFSLSAESELIDVIAWGIEYWGEQPSFRWAREFRNRIERSLAVAPLGCPLAPESEFVSVEVRQLILGRYRVLFEIRARTVNILHIRGPHTGKRQ